MDKSTSILLLYIVTLIVIVFILYTMLKRPQIQIYNEMPPPQKIDTHWWGYGWRPWWRRYAGVPGFGKDKPVPPTIPVSPKPIIIPTA